MYYTAAIAVGVVQKLVKVRILIAAYLVTAVAAKAIAQTPPRPEPGFTALRIDSRFEDWTRLQFLFCKITDIVSDRRSVALTRAAIEHGAAG